MQALQRVAGRASSSPGTRYTVPAAPAPVADGVDDHHPLRAAHLEADVHTGGAAVDQSGALGHPAVPEVPDQDGADAVVTAQQVAAADDEDLAPGRFEVEGGVRWCDLSVTGHTIPLMTNFDSSLPVLPS